MGPYLNGPSVIDTMCQIIRQRRFLAHQSNCYASVRRHIRVVRKQWVSIGLARHHENCLTGCLPTPEPDVRHWLDRLQFPGTIARLWRHRDDASQARWASSISRTSVGPFPSRIQDSIDDQSPSDFLIHQLEMKFVCNRQAKKVGNCGAVKGRQQGDSHEGFQFRWIGHVGEHLHHSDQSPDPAKSRRAISYCAVNLLPFVQPLGAKFAFSPRRISQHDLVDELAGLAYPHATHARDLPSRRNST